MNWEAIKFIYHSVLVCGDRVEYLGGDRYKITAFYSTGEMYVEQEYKNGQLDGKSIVWWKNGNKDSDLRFKEGLLHGKGLHWSEDGMRCEYDNGVCKTIF